MWCKYGLSIPKKCGKEMWCKYGLSTPKKCANIWFPMMRFGWPEHGMSFLRAEPSKTNMHTCKDKNHSARLPLQFLCTAFLGVWRLSAQNGGQTDLGAPSGLSLVDVRRFMPCELAENRFVWVLERSPSSPRHQLRHRFFPEKNGVSVRCLISSVRHRIGALPVPCPKMANFSSRSSLFAAE